MSKKPFPTQIIIYEIDRVKGQPVYAVANEADEIPEEYDGLTVAVYTLTRQRKFKVHRELT